MAKQNFNKKMKFEEWLQHSSIILNSDINDTVVKKALADIGIMNVDVFDEYDELKVRLYVSELVMKREKVKLDNPVEYFAVVNRLLCYAEYLGCDGKIVKLKNSNIDLAENKEQAINAKNCSLRIHEGRDKQQDTLIVSYYLSRINMEAVKELGYDSFKAAFEGLALLLGQKPATIKNMRDEFDPYFDNGRMGWYQRKLAPSRKAVFNRMADVSDEELATIVKEIIMAYSHEDHTVKENWSLHKKIKISSEDMKEIHTRIK